MPKSKLTWEWGDHPDEIIVRKSKGRLTLEELHRFFNEREQLLSLGEGNLMLILWRTSSDSYTGWDMGQADEGDSQSIYVLQDGSTCICGKTELYQQYCPHCGEKLNGGNTQ